MTAARRRRTKWARTARALARRIAGLETAMERALVTLRRERAVLEDQLDAQQGAEPGPASKRHVSAHREPSTTEGAAEWLRFELTQAGEAGVPVGVLRKQCAEMGFSKSPSMLYRARAKLDPAVSVVEFYANPGDPLRWRLRAQVVVPGVRATTGKQGTLENG